MMKSQQYKKNKKLITAITFFIILLLSALLITRTAIEQKDQNLERAGYVISSYANKVQYAIDSRLLNAEILKMIVVDSNGRINDFDRLAQQLSEKDPALRSLQLAPDGNVTYIYPLKGNEDGLGPIFSDPDRRDEAIFARDSGKTTLAGPFELYQGGMGVVARMPIYLSDSEEREHFWGFSTVVLNIPQLFEMADLNALTGQGYSFCIWRNSADTDEILYIHGDERMDLSPSIRSAITVPNGTWTLSLLPLSGHWVDWNSVIILSAIALVLSILISLSVYGYLTIASQKEELSRLSYMDSLTGLFNGRKLSVSLKELIQTKTPFGIGYFDLDKFKQVNDQFGHDVGDSLLIEVAHRIKSCAQEKDMAFRIGGDEFVLLVRGAEDKEFYTEMERKITEKIRQPFTVGENVLYPHISCGFALYPADETNMEKLIKKADTQMYAQKKMLKSARHPSA